MTSAEHRAPPLAGRGVSASTTMAWDWDLGQCIEAWTRVGLPAIGITRAQLEDYGRERGMQQLRDSGLAIANYQGVNVYDLRDPARFAERQAKSLVYFDVAAELGADCVYVTTGPRGGLLGGLADRTLALRVARHLRPLRRDTP